MTVAVIDLNADVGEGFGRWTMGDDEALMDVVSTVSIACGMHAGDPVTMRRTLAAAVARGVSVGAHPGFDDLRGFGRRRITGESPEAIADLVVYQVGALTALAVREGAVIRHVKLHGALSNQAAADPELAAAVGGALAALDPSLTWLIPAGSAMVTAAAAVGLTAVHERFPDRADGPDGGLLPRDQSGAVISDPAAVARRGVEMAAAGAASLCVHGDEPGSVALARALREALTAARYAIRPFAEPQGNRR